MNAQKIFTYTGLAAIIFLLLGLGGWYLFLQNRTGGVARLDEGRGLGTEVPSFLGSTGSTIANIASNFGISIGSDGGSPEMAKPPRLWRVNATPVAGMAFLSGSSTVRFIERSTGYVVDAYPVSGSVVRKSNTLRPQTYRGYVTGAGGVVLQTLRPDFSVETYAGELSTTTIDGFSQLEGTTLVPNIASLATSKNENEIAYTIRGSGPALLIESNLDGSSPQQRISTAVSGWNMHWLREALYLTERGASGVPGSAFRVESGALLPVITNTPGLSFLPHPENSGYLFSSDTGSAISLFIRPEAEASVAELPLQTIAEKCVWLPNKNLTAWCAVPKETPRNNYMDSWNRGTVHTSDTWWKIEGGAGSADEVFDINEVEPIEITQPIIDESGSYIAFINGWDKSLWILRIEE